MLKPMQKKALQLALEAEENKGSSENSDASFTSIRQAGKYESSVVDSDSSSKAGENEELGKGRIENSRNRPSSGVLGSRGTGVKEKLERELSPIELEVEDVSYQHAGHAAVRGNGDGETHFNLRIVSNSFEGKSLIKWQRLIFDLLQEELQSGLHALSIVAKTPAEV